LWRASRLLAELPRHKLCYKVDKLFVGNACTLLKEAIQSDPPRSPSSMAGGWVIGGVQKQPVITGGALQQQPAQPPDVLEAYQKNKSRYSVFLLYWYKSTHTDAEGAA